MDDFKAIDGFLGEFILYTDSDFGRLDEDVDRAAAQSLQRERSLGARRCGTGTMCAGNSLRKGRFDKLDDMRGSRRLASGR